MKTESAMDRARRELIRALDTTRADLDRIEIWTAAMNAFSRPIPDYEPVFLNMRQLALTAHEI